MTAKRETVMQELNLTEHAKLVHELKNHLSLLKALHEQMGGRDDRARLRLLSKYNAKCVVAVQKMETALVKLSSLCHAAR